MLRASDHVNFAAEGEGSSGGTRVDSLVVEQVLQIWRPTEPRI